MKTNKLIIILIIMMLCMFVENWDYLKIVNASSEIVSDDLMVYWHYDEGITGNNINNIAPNYKGNYNGVLENGLTTNGNSISFDGSDDYISFTETPSVNQYTLEFWVKFNNLNNNQFLFHSYEGTNRVQLGYRQNTSKMEYYSIFDYFSSLSIDWSSTSYNHVVLVANSDQSKLYLNGVGIGSGNLYDTPRLLPTSNVGVFTNSSNGIRSNYLNGELKSFKLYKKSLSESEIIQNYSVGMDNIGLPIPLQNSTDTVKVKTGIKSGGIHVDYQESSPANFGNIITDGSIQTITTPLDNVLIQDHMGTGNGWTLSLQATPFSEVTASGGTPMGLSLPNGSLTYKGILSISQTVTTKLTSDSIIDNGSPVVIAVAGIGEGMGDTIINHQVPGIELQIDTSEKYVNPNNLNESGATPYESIFTWSVSTGP